MFPVCFYILKSRLISNIVGSLRKFGFQGDIVLAVNPLEKMPVNVQKYLQKVDVVAYGFQVQCKGNDDCKFQDDFLGYPDPRPHRTFGKSGRTRCRLLFYAH